MGIQETQIASGGESERRAMQRVLRDLDAVETMLSEGAFETDRRRIGAEQELVLVDGSLQPAPVAMEVLERLQDPRIVPEIAKFNLEFNCDPIDLGGPCLRVLEDQLREVLEHIRLVALEFGARPLLTGICPTSDLAHLSRENIVPRDRYFALDDVIRSMRGTDYELRIEGADELIVHHPSIMLEALNASFQVHYQTTPDEFASAYNTALAVAAPVLAAGTNSPILFGKRLWQETRIPIFQQVVDTRTEGAGQREMLARVRFGEEWARSSVLDVLRADVARFRQVLAATDRNVEDPFEAMGEGRAPKLGAFQTFNSCVYRWMRPCYGVTAGKPHLRIENRVLPAGPTVLDEVSNAAFWIGLMAEGVYAWPDIPAHLELRDARANFLRAARDGLSCHMTWLDGAERPIRELIADEFIPVATRGLQRSGVDSQDIERCMGVISERVESRHTGSRWVLGSVAKMRGQGTRAQRLHCITRAMIENQDTSLPVHEWPYAELVDSDSMGSSFALVSQCMTTDLYTVSEHECLELVASIMDWENLRHIPVESSDHTLVGLVSYRALLRRLAKSKRNNEGDTIPVSSVMVRELVTVTPDTPTLEAISLMHKHKVSCLPVTEKGRLVGIVSERDYTEIARKLLERELSGGSGS